MATAEELKAIVRLSVKDGDFRAALEKDPVKTAARIGVVLSPLQARSMNSNTVEAEEAAPREAKSILFPVRL